jgi:hypothetical protein
VGAVFACSPSSDAPATRAALSPAAPAVSAQRAQRRPVLDALAATLRERYVNPPVAEQAITDDKAFAEAVSAEASHRWVRVYRRAG